MSSYTSQTINIGDFSDDDAAEESWPDLEFRSPVDEAWYGVDVWDLCDSLVVSFNGFSCSYDEVYSPRDFENLEEIKEFEERFRVTSVQMQDVECPTVQEGTRVCATCPSVSGEVKFYDALVVGVEREKHGRDEEGNEVCGCSFRLSWKQGPFADETTVSKVGDICLKQEEDRMNPKVVSFFKEARRQICGGEVLQGEETEWQKILKKVTSVMQNHKLSG
ncbi:unnamed protein product [Cochlearia groenlandica]